MDDRWYVGGGLCWDDNFNIKRWPPTNIRVDIHRPLISYTCDPKRGATNALGDPCAYRNSQSDSQAYSDPDMDVR